MRRPNLRLLAWWPLALAAALAVGVAPAAQLAFATPQVYKVNRTDDVVTTTCSGVNDCSLRGAVQNANANPGSTYDTFLPLARR